MANHGLSSILDLWFERIWSTLLKSENN